MSNITIEKKHEDSGTKALAVTVPADRVKRAEERAIKRLASRARLPGFRKGKIPAPIVRKRFGDAIRQSVLEEVVQESWQQAQESESLTDVLDRHVHNLKMPDDGPIEFDFVIEVKPTLNLERTGGFTLTREVEPVTDEQVAEQLHKLREQRASWLPLEGQKPAPGNMVRLEVVALEGEDAGEAKPYSLVLGEGNAVPALEEVIMGLLPGETEEATIRFGGDQEGEGAEEAKSRRLKVTLLEVKRQELPEADDAFAKEVGEFDDLAALEQAIRQDLEEAAGRDADSRVREQLTSEIASANGVDAPQSMVMRLLQAYAQSYGVPDDQSQNFTTQFRPVAESQVKRELILDAVARAENLAATEEELDQRVAEIAESRKAPVAEVYAALEKSKRLPEIARAITEKKVFDHLLAQSTINEVTK